MYFGRGGYNQGTEEEIKQRIAKVYGIPVNQLPPMDIKFELQRNRDNWMKISELTAPYKLFLKGLTHTSKDKFEELTDIGHFILAWQNELQLMVPDEPMEYPDFTVRSFERIVGIEHTRLINPTLKARFNNAKLVIGDAEVILKSRNLDYKCTVNIFINFHKSALNDKTFGKSMFTRTEKRQVSTVVADYIES